MAEYAIIPYADYVAACDAVREKTGSTDKIVSKDLGPAILTIETGGDFSEVNLVLDEINGEVVGEAQYTVTFVGEDLAQLGAVSVFEGYDCPDPVATVVFETPTKESTRYINYTFSGWAMTEGGSADPNALKAIESDRTLYAVFAEEYIYLAKGDCGHVDYEFDYDIIWTINPDYVLELTGNGWMVQDYYDTSPPWSAYADKITSIIVNEGITRIAAAAFENCIAVTDVTLPNSASSIRPRLFKGCSALTNVVFRHSTSMLTLMSSCFEGCTSLKAITLPSACYGIYGDAFHYCTALERVVFESTEGWCIGEGDYDTTTPFTEADLSDPAAMADYLVNTMTYKQLLVHNYGGES